MSSTALPAPQPSAEHRHLCGPPDRVAEEITVPFGDLRGPRILRDSRFLDLRDEIEDLLHPAGTAVA